MNSYRSSRRVEAIDRILGRVEETAGQVRPEFPFIADGETGVWQTLPDGRWTGGFWVGMLWLAHRYNGARATAELAREWMRRLSARLSVANGLNGLVFSYGAVLPASLVGDEEARQFALRAASAFADDFDEAAGIFPMGPRSASADTAGGIESHIDGLPGMALPLWAAEASGNQTFRRQALSHGWQHVTACLRQDGSLLQAASFDPETGGVRDSYNSRGHDRSSRWARAQSWGLLGLVVLASSDRGFLAVACRAAESWIAATDADRVAFWDFDDPEIPACERDTSATAMAAVALLKLGELCEDRRASARYRRHAEESMDVLVESNLTPLDWRDARPPGMLTEGCWQRNTGQGTKHELIWGSYFMLEALLLLEGRIPAIWRH